MTPKTYSQYLNIKLNILISFFLMVTGGVLNLFAIATNFGYMPVKCGYQAVIGANYKAYNRFSEVSMPYLTDFIKIPLPSDYSLFISPGDIVAGIGGLFLLFCCYKLLRLKL